MASTGNGPLLHNVVSCDERVRIAMREGWKDQATGWTHYAGNITGTVVSRCSHRVSIHAGDGKCYVLRRVDIIEINKVA